MPQVVIGGQRVTVGDSAINVSLVGGPATGAAGAFQTTVTVFSFVGGGRYPVTGRRETGGVTAPTIGVSPTTFAFDVNVLISPFADKPPPDGGVVRPVKP